MTFKNILVSLVCLFFLVAWSPLEVSNSSVIRLSSESQDFCSGVVIDRINKDEMYVASAAHCADATSRYIEKKIEYPDGRVVKKRVKVFPEIEVKQDRVDASGNVYFLISAKASFVRWDKANDVAIYKIKVFSDLFTPAVLSLSDVKYGDKVYAMGMPMGIWGTISSGEVTKPKIGDVQNIPSIIPKDAIVHTAYMKPGISGGGLFNDKGELIGLTNWGLSGGPYIATRVSHIIDLLNKVKDEG